MGLMVSRLSAYRLGDVLAQMNLSTELPEVKRRTGPDRRSKKFCERGFLLHVPAGNWGIVVSHFRNRICGGYVARRPTIAMADKDPMD